MILEMVVMVGLVGVDLHITSSSTQINHSATTRTTFQSVCLPTMALHM